MKHCLRTTSPSFDEPCLQGSRQNRIVGQAIVIASVCLLTSLPAVAQTSRASQIHGAIDNKVRVTRTGNRHPLARAEYDRGIAPSDLRMARMMLVLDSSPFQQQELDALVESQQDPSSPQFHQFLTPEEFGQRFGVAEDDLAKTANWLTSQGFTVEPADGALRTIIFSGNAMQVQAAFHTAIHIYNVRGKRHYANASDPQIPAALASVVHGVVTLHDFGPAPQLIQGGPVAELTSGGSHYMGPADFAMIYNTRDLYNNSIDGSGQSIAVIGRSNFKPTDVQAFRSRFALPAKDPMVVLVGTDPGVVSNDELGEATLDVEWAGAVAKNANVQFVLAASTAASDGVVLASQYAVNHNVAPVISLSFGSCEAALGSSGNRFWNSLWQQAAAQGITVLVASGDSGAAGCDSPTDTTGTQASVNGLCSSPYATCVGGTQFIDDSNPGAYWLSSSDPTTLASVLSYIPEAAWNQSASNGGSGLWSTAGGASSYYIKPSWQTGPGVPADGRRDVPDLSLNASTHDGYVAAMNGSLTVFGGTSASTPSMAGIVAMLNQKQGSRQGNINPTLYSLASSNSAIFHDVLTSNNTVPGVSGYNAGAGYDLVSGLGSVDAARMINGWNQPAVLKPAPAFQLNVAPSSVTLAAGSSVQVSAQVSITDGFNSPVSLSVSNLPSWITATFAPATLAGPGSGTSTLTLSANSNAVAAQLSLVVNASAAGVSHTSNLNVTVPCSYSLSSTSTLIASTGGSALVNVITAAGCQWNATSSTSWIAISSGASGSGSGPIQLTVAQNSNGVARTGTVTIAGTVFSVTQAAAQCIYTVSPSPFTVVSGGYLSTFAITAPSGCDWTALSGSSWISASNAGGSGNGTTDVFAQTNTTGVARSGSLTLAGYTYTLNER